jgi:hypothetical protein
VNFSKTFLAYKDLVEKQSRHQLQRLIKYNGGKYVNNKFSSYYTALDIQMKHIVPYTPQQNSGFDRKNHTLKEMPNCMIRSKGLSLNYWEEAIHCENYIVNNTPTKALKNTTLEELWTNLGFIPAFNLGFSFPFPIILHFIPP